LAEPRIVAFLCEWCAYRAADEAGKSRLSYPQTLLSVRVMCTGRVEPAFVLKAFREGADGVLIAGCHPGSCHYVDGNLRAAARHALLARTLAQLGISPERCRLEWMDGSDPGRFASIVREMTERLRALGPLPLSAAGPGGPEGRAAPVAVGSGKPKVAFYWNASCGGCEEAILDLGEELLPLLAEADIVLWPLALDAKRRDVEALPDGSIDVTFLSGAVRLSEQEDWARLLRRKSKLLVALGACAHTGGVVGLGNLADRGAILDAAYRTAPSLEGCDGPLPGEAARLNGRDVTLPGLLPRTLPLASVADVDCVVPGCPPSPDLLASAIRRILAGDVPPPGAVLAPALSLCQDCERRASKPDRLELDVLRDPATFIPDANCFLAQGMVCMGPATRSGCQAACVGANMPCRGCFGPQDGVLDQGAAMLSAMASLFRGDESRLRRLASEVPDPAGTFYRYGLAAGRTGGEP
jgi:F420-non-reducing hydrogenase small subunit